MVFAVTDKEKGADGGVTCFLVDRERRLDLRRRSPTMGEWGPASLSLPGRAGAALGDPRRGGPRLRAGDALDRQGPLHAAGAGARRVRAARRDGRWSTPGTGRPSARRSPTRQAIQWMIADSAVEIEALRWLVLTAAWQVDHDLDSRQAQSMAKLYGGVKANEIVDRMLQIHGGHGLHPRAADRAVVPRAPAAPHLRGHRRDPAPHHRPQPAGRPRLACAATWDDAPGDRAPTTGTTGRSTPCSRPGGRPRVSLVVPARNEAATVGDVVTRVRERLVDTVRAAGRDRGHRLRLHRRRPYAVAADAGAVVHRAAEIRPDLGTHPRQGRGDVEVAVRDHAATCSSSWTPTCSTGTPTSCPGLLGPLLTDPGSSWSRGSTSGPAGRRRRYDGGRVTELVARPLISLLFPDAGRRCTSRWPGSGRSGGRCSSRCRCRPGTPSSWPR